MNALFESALTALKENVDTQYLCNSTIKSWFEYEDKENALAWAEEHIPDFDDDIKQIQAINYFFYYALKSKIDNKYETEYYLIDGVFNIIENPYFMELVDYFELNNVVIVSEAKCENVIAFLNNGFKAERCDIKLRDKWNTEEYRTLFGSAIFMSK